MYHVHALCDTFLVKSVWQRESSLVCAQPNVSLRHSGLEEFVERRRELDRFGNLDMLRWLHPTHFVRSVYTHGSVCVACCWQYAHGWRKLIDMSCLCLCVIFTYFYLYLSILFNLFILYVQPGLLPRPSYSLGRELGSEQLACVGRLLTTFAYNTRLLRHYYYDVIKFRRSSLSLI